MESLIFAFDVILLVVLSRYVFLADRKRLKEPDLGLFAFKRDQTARSADAKPQRGSRA